jgi:WhiB family redox-sensing transcriptional regulator
MVPALAKHVRRCAGCGTQIATQRWARQYGVKVHAGRGLCQPCLRKDVAPLARPGEERDLPSRRDRSWLAQAICVDVEDPEMFFPITRDKNTVQWREAKAVCGNCPVTTECLEDALAQGSVYGVRAGLDEDQLQELHRSRNRRTA